MRARREMENKSNPPYNKASSINKDSSNKDNMNNDEQKVLERLMTRDEQAILERRKAWERAREEEKD